MTQQDKPLFIKPGVYRHYKGKLYEIYDMARHSETGEDLVIYRCLYGDRDLWVRPFSMFVESVNLNGNELPRFEWISDSEDEAEN